MNINHRHYILILFAVAALLFSAAGYVFLYQKVVSQTRNLSTARAEVALETEKKLHEQDLTDAYANSESDRTRINSIVVSEQDIVPFIESLEKIGTDGGADLQLSGIAPDPAPKSGLSHIGAHVDVRGSWQNIMRTLVLLENTPFALSLANLKIGTTGSEDVIENANKKLPPEKVKEWLLSADIKVISTK